MAKIRIVGDSSGYVELAAPNAAGNNTLELPSNATKLVGADASNSLNVTGIATFSGGINVGTGASISSPATNVLTLGTNNVERLRIDNAGRLGIGTTNPTVALQLSPDASISNVNVNNPLSSVAGAALTVAQFFHTNANGSYLRIKATRLSNGSSWTTASTKIVQVTDVTEQAYIEFNPSGGNYGMAFGGYNDTNGLIEERLRIDSRGRVTMPYQPHAEGGINSGASNTTPTTSEIIRFNRADINVGNHYDTTNYRFNCPVNGNYLVKAHAQTGGQTATTANTVNFNIRKNGASVSGAYESRYYGASAPGYVKLEITDVVYANAGDYLDIYAIISNTSLSLEYNAADIRWRFSYTLLG